MQKTSSRIFLTFLLFLFICNAKALVNTKTAVQNAYNDWCAAISQAKGDPEMITKFYAQDAILLPTLSSRILRNHNGGLNAYFIKFTSSPDIQCKTEQLITQIYGDMAINSGSYDFSFTEKNGKTKTIAARFTFVYKEEDGQWLIVAHHSSILPVQ
jgi:uncharacterized protein (TIGR02246 family)